MISCDLVIAVLSCISLIRISFCCACRGAGHEANGRKAKASVSGGAAAAAVAAPGQAVEKRKTWPLIKELLTSPGFEVPLN